MKLPTVYLDFLNAFFSPSFLRGTWQKFIKMWLIAWIIYFYIIISIIYFTFWDAQNKQENQDLKQFSYQK